MISVIIPLYNKRENIGASLQSVLKQSYQDFEVVVVDDGSTDGSAEVVKRFNDQRIRLIHQSNAGVSAARNRGIEETKGEYVAFLDADDEWKPTFLEHLGQLVSKFPECDVFAVDYELHYPNGEIRNNIINKLPFSGVSGILTNYFEVASCSNPPLWTSAVMVRTQAMKEIGGFPIGITSGEDLLTWARLAVNGKIAYSRERLAIYNMGEGYDLAKLPSRRQDKGDYVGKELLKLYHQHPQTPGLRKYISMWHKMRASVAVRFGNRRETLKEVAKALRFNPGNYKALMFAPLAMLPQNLRIKLISKWKR